jgi:hypothetical protein
MNPILGMACRCRDDQSGDQADSSWKVGFQRAGAATTKRHRYGKPYFRKSTILWVFSYTADAGGAMAGCSGLRCATAVRSVGVNPLHAGGGAPGGEAVWRSRQRRHSPRFTADNGGRFWKIHSVEPLARRVP